MYRGERNDYIFGRARGSPTARKHSLLFGGAYAPNDAIYRKRYAFTEIIMPYNFYFSRARQRKQLSTVLCLAYPPLRPFLAVFIILSKGINMRLQEVYFICQSLKENWQDLSFEERKINGGVFYKLSNLSNVKSNLKLASEITSFKQVVKNIENYSPGFNVVEGEVVLDPRGRNAFSADYNQLNLKITTIIDLFDSFDYKQSDNGFDIKLPPEITLSELGKCSKDLDQIFSTCPLLSRENATISLSSVDVGSIWLSFLVGGTAIATVLSMVAVLIDKALIIRSHYLTTKTQMETYRSIKLSNDMIERMDDPDVLRRDEPKALSVY